MSKKDEPSAPKANTAPSTTARRTRPGSPFPMALPDDPIFSRGWLIGSVRSTPSSTSGATSRTPSREPEAALQSPRVVETSSAARDELLAYCEANDRVCPNPPEWHDLWALLPGAPTPLILAAWHHATDRQKRACLREQLKGASAQALAQADAFLRSLTEDQWHHATPSGGRPRSPGNSQL